MDLQHLPPRHHCQCRFHMRSCRSGRHSVMDCGWNFSGDHLLAVSDALENLTQLQPFSADAIRPLRGHAVAMERQCVIHSPYI